MLKKAEHRNAIRSRRLICDTLLESKDIPKDPKTQKETIVRSTVLAHGILGVFHASANTALDLTTTELLVSVGKLVEDMQHFPSQKKRKGGKQ